MSTPAITWGVTVGILAIALIFHLIHSVRLHTNHKHNIIRTGSEREMFFIPGDPLNDDDDD